MRMILLIIGSVLPIVSVTAYVISIIKGQTRPQRMTRFLLLVITALMFGSLLTGGDTSGVWLALVSFLQALFVWVLSLKRGMGGRDVLDLVCLGLCIAGIAVWLLSGWPWIGLIASIAADCIAMVPALRKTIRLPHTELMLFYALDTLAGLVILCAGPFTLTAMLFPAYIALINFVFVLAIRWPRRERVSVSDA